MGHRYVKIWKEPHGAQVCKNLGRNHMGHRYVKIWEGTTWGTGM